MEREEGWDPAPLPATGLAGPQPSPHRPPIPGKHPPWDGVNQGFPGSGNRNKLRIGRGEK